MTLENIITTAAIATLASSLVTITVNYFIFWKNSRTGGIARLDNELNQILAISIQYPYLENEDFIAEWSERKKRTDERFLRYDIYCIYNFNFLHDLCRFYKFKKKEIENHVHIQEIIRTHAEWWKKPTSQYSNVEGYDEQFRAFINSYLP